MTELTKTVAIEIEEMWWQWLVRTCRFKWALRRSKKGRRFDFTQGDGRNHFVNVKQDVIGPPSDRFRRIRVEGKCEVRPRVGDEFVVFNFGINKRVVMVVTEMVKVRRGRFGCWIEFVDLETDLPHKPYVPSYGWGLMTDNPRYAR